MLYQLQQNLLSAGSNYFPYSTYNSTAWTCSATDAGHISAGTHPADIFTINATTGVTTVTDGNQTWTGNGTFRSVDSVDASAWTTLVVQAVVGPHIANTSPSMTVVMGFCDSDGSNPTTEATWTITGTKTVWFTKAIADITKTTSALYVYWAVTNAGSWWIDQMQIAKDGTAAVDYVHTSGAAISRTSDQNTQAVVKTCPDCRYRRFVIRPPRVGPSIPPVPGFNIEVQ